TDELDGDLVPGLEVGMPAEVRQVFALLLTHVVAVGLACLQHPLPPLLAGGRVGSHLADGVTDLVVVLDRILRLAAGALGPTAALSELKQTRVEEALLRLGV